MDEEVTQRSMATALESKMVSDTISAAGESIEFINSAALVHEDTGKIPKCFWIVDERPSSCPASASGGSHTTLRSGHGPRPHRRVGM
jgi:hypothetical protein